MMIMMMMMMMMVEGQCGSLLGGWCHKMTNSIVDTRQPVPAVVLNVYFYLKIWASFHLVFSPL